MGCGCGTDHNSGKAVVDRLREKGFSDNKMRQSYEIACECGNTFSMDTFMARCPQCNMVYGVTPCSQGDIANIRAAGVNY